MVITLFAFDCFSKDKNTGASALGQSLACKTSGRQRSGELAEAIDHGDKSIEDLVRSRMRTVGIVLSNFIDFINPDLVLLGGGLVESMPKLVREEVKRAIKDHATPDAGRAVRVVVSKLKRHAVTTGAAQLALFGLQPAKRTKRDG